MTVDKSAIVDAAQTWHVEWTDQRGRKRTIRQKTLDGKPSSLLDFGGEG